MLMFHFLLNMHSDLNPLYCIILVKEKIVQKANRIQLKMCTKPLPEGENCDCSQEDILKSLSVKQLKTNG